MQTARTVNERCIGITVSVQVSPYKLLDSRDRGEGMDCLERAVAVVAQNRGQTAGRAEHNVEISVSLDVHGPRTGVGRAENLLRQFGLRGHVGELRWIVLAHKAQAARAGQHEIGLEIVVEINGQNGLGRWSCIPRTAGKWKQRAR